MSSGNYTSWVARALTYLMITTVSTLAVGISTASAEEPFSPSAPVVNDPAGVSQDWFMVQGDGQTYGYYWDVNGTNAIPQGSQVPVSTGGSVTVYARHYQGAVQPFTMTFTNAAGAPAPNTVTLHTDQMVCGKYSSGSTWLPVTWNETYDGTGLTSNSPGVNFIGDGGENYDLRIENTGANSPHIRPDGSSIRLDLQYNVYKPLWAGLLPGWYTVIPSRLSDDSSSVITEAPQTHQRLWVPACGYLAPPVGQVPPGGVVPDPETTDPETSSTSATGKLRFLHKIDRVKVKAINLKVASRTTFTLKRPGVKKPMTILAPAGEIVVKKARALKAGKYVLKARIKKNGQWSYKPVATLVVRR